MSDHSHKSRLIEYVAQPELLSVSLTGGTYVYVHEDPKTFEDFSDYLLVHIPFIFSYGGELDHDNFQFIQALGI